MTILRELWLIISKLILSFFKKEYTIHDYPLRVSRSHISGKPEQDWVVQVINWPLMIAVGDTLEQAMLHLQESMSGYRNLHGALPRPGTSVPIPHDFDPFFELEPLIEDFEEKVLELPEEEIIALSPESTLHELAVTKPVDYYVHRILDVYDVDVRGVKNLNMLEIFRKINAESGWDDPNVM